MNKNPIEDQDMKDTLQNKSVLDSFYNLSYAHDLEFSIFNLGSLKPGKNEFHVKEWVVLVELKVIPTIFHGNCHVFDLLECTKCSYSFYDIIYNQNLDLMDVPRSFNIYFTERNRWQVA